jgi:hypothetical protein
VVVPLVIDGAGPWPFSAGDLTSASAGLSVLGATASCTLRAHQVKVNQNNIETEELTWRVRHQAQMDQWATGEAVACPPWEQEGPREAESPLKSRGMKDTERTSEMAEG